MMTWFVLPLISVSKKTQHWCSVVLIAASDIISVVVVAAVLVDDDDYDDAFSYKTSILMRNIRTVSDDDMVLVTVDFCV